MEPWVLNAQRGVSFATGIKMSEADRITEGLLQKMTDNSLVRQADLDQFEYSSEVLFGGLLKKTAATPGTQLNRIQSMARSVTEVQGMKRLNMLRTFRKGLGKELRNSWEQARPGDWDKMKEAADLRAGRILDDDDFALQVVGEQMFANDLVVERLGHVAGQAGYKADFANAIKTGAWHTPTDLGELKALDLDHVASALRLTDAKGNDIKDLNRLRQALATESDMMDKVKDGLTRLGADPDYVRRVGHALDFSWGGFWKTAETRFALTADESSALQTMMAEAAKLRGMTPVEFMSQVFSPSLIDGTEGVLGYLEGPARILREARAAGRKVKARDAKLAETRTVLAGKEGASTRMDLVRQMSAAFSAHLDPSAKRALLLEFEPELRKSVLSGEVRFDLKDLQKMWDSKAENMLADRILGYMDGKLGTGNHQVIDDASRGVSSVRDGAASYMRQRGVEPISERRYYESDEPFYEESARAYSALPETPYERTGRRPTIQSIRKSDVDLKPKPAGVDDRTYAAYQDMVVDTRAQWDHMTKPTKKGGMGIKVIVAKGDPYADSAAMRADVAKGQLRVFAGNADHPLMTNEQNVMFRAVHDVFGHAAEGFEFGPRGELNAAIKHSQMYSDTGRAAMLTETHGQTSWVNYSDDMVPSPPQAPLPRTWVEYEKEFPFEKPGDLGPDDPFAIEITGETNYGTTELMQLTIKERVGEGLKALPGTQQEFILSRMARMQRRFPDHKVWHIDVPDDLHVAADQGGFGLEPGVKGVTWGSDEGEAVILLSPDYYGMEFDPTSAKDIQTSMMFGQATHKKVGDQLGAEIWRERESLPGVPHAAAGGGVEHTLYHEMGHAVDSKLRPVIGFMGDTPRRLPENGAYFDFMEEFDKSLARKQLSEYAFNNTGDSAAELFAVANRIADDPTFPMDVLMPELRGAIEEYTQLLKDMGVWIDDAPNPLAGKTVREANAAKRGSVYAEQKAGLLPQGLLDRFGDQFVGRGKHVESNPDVARTAQMFGKWSQAVIGNGLLKGDQAVHAGLLNDIAGIPTHAAVPYNYTEGAATNLAMQSMTRKWDDAFRLQYFAQERSWIERSINHPMFGLYPASYMWGKIMPELVRFIANEPFGNKTGGLLYSLMDTQAAIALRREYDPTFDANIENIGHSQAMSFAGYMMPTLPWDVSASAPAWMRGLAEQGRSNEQAAAEGGVNEDISLLKPITGTFEKLVPLTTTVPWAARAIGEVQPGNDDARIQASELGPELQRVMQELQEALR